MRILSRPEELVLLAVWKLKDDAYGVNIRNLIIEETGMDWTIGAIYVPLSRLSKWDYLETIIGDPTPERGGKRKKFYRLTDAGIEALSLIKKVNESMWSDIPETGLEAGI